MKEKVASLETTIAIMRNDITALANKEATLPLWVRRSAVAMVFAVFSQTIAVVWWASSISTNVEYIAKEVKMNTEFRMAFPKMHEEVMVKLSKIEVQSAIMDSRLKDVLSDHKQINN
jgi:NADH:ubiquinone oxidoreductase subunit 5 (subunit L)/multisubunit Na+/H+ antiporter MnhA subunit